MRSLLSIYDLQDLLRHDVPWWTFEASDRVAGFLATRPEARVFEWGSGRLDRLAVAPGRLGDVRRARRGAGPRSWRRCCPATPSCTSSRRCRLSASPDEELSEKPGFEGLDFADYVAAVDDTDGTFDLVVVDGRARNACFHRADLPARAGRCARLRQRGPASATATPSRRPRCRVDVEWTRGLTPALPYPTRTALVRLRD